MRAVNGKHIREIDGAEVAAWSETYQEVTIDLGAGDGRFVRQLARQEPKHGGIGVDLCAANLCVASRGATDNALFVIADALALPEELHSVATRVTINFPWGSLLRGLLTGHAGLIGGLRAASRDEMSLDLVLNAGALAEASWTLDAGGQQVMTVLCDAGFRVGATSLLGPTELRHVPTTWAKRLAFGRDPRGLHISATMQAIDVSLCRSTTGQPSSRLATHDSRLTTRVQPTADVLHLRAGRRGAGLLTNM
jgi:16S rRNA (adenine(1408)-N(1))-methyltransferase